MKNGNVLHVNYTTWQCWDMLVRAKSVQCGLVINCMHTNMCSQYYTYQFKHVEFESQLSQPRTNLMSKNNPVIRTKFTYMHASKLYSSLENDKTNIDTSELKKNIKQKIIEYIHQGHRYSHRLHHHCRYGGQCVSLPLVSTTETWQSIPYWPRNCLYSRRKQVLLFSKWGESGFGNKKKENRC